MITDYQKFMLPDQRGKNNMVGEVNWSDDSTSNESKIIKFTTETGETLFVRREDLNQILFAIGDPESQKKLIPTKVVPVHWRETVLGIKATKDIKRGEMINFPIKISFPCTNIQEFIGQDRTWQKDVAKEQRKDIWTPTGYSPEVKH